MRTFLITWSPKRWEWEALAAAATAVREGHSEADRWSCGKRKDIQPGERLILLRQGREPRGIVGALLLRSGQTEPDGLGPKSTDVLLCRETV